jgi:hypothetical protein
MDLWAGVFFCDRLSDDMIGGVIEPLHMALFALFCSHLSERFGEPSRRLHSTPLVSTNGAVLDG